MTDGRVVFTKKTITLDLQDTVPPTPTPISFSGTTVKFPLDEFDIVKSFVVPITGSKTSTRVGVVIVGREIV